MPPYSPVPDTLQGDEARDLEAFQVPPLCEVKDHLRQTQPSDPGDAFFAQVVVFAMNNAKIPAKIPWYHRAWRAVARPYLVVATTLSTAAAAVLFFVWFSGGPAVMTNPPVNVVVTEVDGAASAEDLSDPFSAVDQLASVELEALAASLQEPMGVPTSDVIDPDDAIDPLGALDELNAEELASLQASLQHF